MLVESEIRKGLKTVVFGKREIIVYDETGSTNDVAYRLGAESFPEGTIVIAESQTCGRGRHGRTWISIPGQSISFSIILRPGIDLSSAPGVTLVAAVAVSDTLHEFSIHTHSIKWPNDILINSKKVCGILTELKASGGNVEFIITGIGINTGHVIELIPAELKSTASSIGDETGRRIDRTAFLCALLLNFEKRYNEFINSGLSGIIVEWEKNSNIKGRMVSAKTSYGTVTGSVRCIMPDGSLEIETEDGIIRIASGEINLI